MITKDSIMNFEVNALVDHYGRQAIVCSLFKKNIRIHYLDNSQFDNIHYSDLHLLEYEKFLHPIDKNRAQWTATDHEYVLNNIHMSSETLAVQLKRTVDGIDARKHLIRKRNKLNSELK
jgi:hypothetical protein